MTISQMTNLKKMKIKIQATREMLTVIFRRT